MPPIHRLLCTHCTFGTSELESSTTENAGKVFGYSVRKSSLSDADRGQVRQLFRAIERLLSYYLPKDATAAHKAELSADSAPRRLIFVPNLGGWQVAGQVSYRSHDTAGRPGSYFADLLVDKAPDARGRDAAPGWSPIDAIRLWSTGRDRHTVPDAGWWISSEEQLLSLEADGPGRPAPLSTVADLRDGRLPLIDDALLHRFLTAESGSVEAMDDPLVPERWWRMPAADRRSFVEAILQATILGPARPGRETVTIAAEPSVAAIVFFAVFRLLPPPIAALISFSTFESTPERPLTGLVATTFMDEVNPAADLPPELYQRGFACNTFRDLSKRGRAQAPAERGYVRHVVDLAARAAWTELDDFLSALATTKGLTAGSLDALSAIDRFVASYMQRQPIPKPQIQARSAEERFLRKHFCNAVESHADSRHDWPDDLLEKAIDWLGDDLPGVWEKADSIRAVLERHLPLLDDPLRRLLIRHPPAPRCIVSAAIVAATTKATPQVLPDAFLRCCGDICSKADQRRSEAVQLVLDVVQMLPDVERRAILLPASSLPLPFLDLLFDAVRDLDQPTYDRLKLPLADMLCSTITEFRRPEIKGTQVRSLIHFLDRYVAFADPKCPHHLSTCHDGLRADIRKLLEWLAQDDRYRFLAADHRSLVPSLLKWLRYSGPNPLLQETFDHWAGLHEAAIALDSLRDLRRKARPSLDMAISALHALKPHATEDWDDNPQMQIDHYNSQKDLITATFLALGIKVSDDAPPLSWVLKNLKADHPALIRSEKHARKRLILALIKAIVGVALFAILLYFTLDFVFRYWRPPHRANTSEGTSGKPSSSASSTKKNSRQPPAADLQKQPTKQSSALSPQKDSIPTRDEHAH